MENWVYLTCCQINITWVQGTKGWLTKHCSIRLWNRFPLVRIKSVKKLTNHNSLCRSSRPDCLHMVWKTNFQSMLERNSLNLHLGEVTRSFFFWKINGMVLSTKTISKCNPFIWLGLPEMLSNQNNKVMLKTNSLNLGSAFPTFLC